MQITMPISGNQIALTQDGTPWTQSATLSTLQAGDTIAIAPFCCGPSINAFTGNAITISNVTVYGAPANAVTLNYATNSTVDGVRIVPKPGTGLIGSNADGIDLGIGQNNHLKNSYVTGTLDDAMTAGGGLLELSSTRQVHGSLRSHVPDTRGFRVERSSTLSILSRHSNRQDRLSFRKFQRL